MPRIRTLKPEHRQHRKIGPLSHLHYRLWVGMICEADDEGRLVCDAQQLRALIFAYHPGVTVRVIEAGLAALESIGLVRLYAIGLVRYADFPSWSDHQRINRKQPSNITSYKDSLNDHGTITEHSLNDHGSFTGDRKGREGKGREGIGGESEGNQAGSPEGAIPRPLAQARPILEFLNRKAEKHYQPTDVNLGLIAARLKDGATPAQCRAVIARKVSKWKGDAKMDEFLRPATLFGKTNFAQYQGELPASAFAEEESHVTP